MDSKYELKHTESWSGDYRGVSFEIVHWYLGWNYYLNIPIKQLPLDVQPIFALKGRTLKDDTHKRLYYNYSGARIISNLDWHCGITLYEKVRDERGNVIGYRIGCDYMHYWDEGHVYNLSVIERDAIQSINKLWELVPNLLLRSAWNGEFFPKDKVYYTDKGVCVAVEHRKNITKENYHGKNKSPFCF